MTNDSGRVAIFAATITGVSAFMQRPLKLARTFALCVSLILLLQAVCSQALAQTEQQVFVPLGPGGASLVLDAGDYSIDIIGGAWYSPAQGRWSVSFTVRKFVAGQPETRSFSGGLASSPAEARRAFGGWHTAQDDFITLDSRQTVTFIEWGPIDPDLSGSLTLLVRPIPANPLEAGSLDQIATTVTRFLATSAETTAAVVQRWSSNLTEFVAALTARPGGLGRALGVAANTADPLLDPENAANISTLVRNHAATGGIFGSQNTRAVLQQIDNNQHPLFRLNQPVSAQRPQRSAQNMPASVLSVLNYNAPVLGGMVHLVAADPVSVLEFRTGPGNPRFMGIIVPYSGAHQPLYLVEVPQGAGWQSFAVAQPLAELVFPEPVRTFRLTRLDLDGAPDLPDLAELSWVPGLVFDDDGSFTGSVTAIAVDIDPAGTTTTLAAPATGAFGENLVFTATVASLEGIPRGQVSFRNGDQEFASAELNAAGVATVSAMLPVGGNAVAAHYLGTAEFAASASGVQQVTVSPGTQSITFAAIPAQDFAPGATVSLVASATSGLAVELVSQTPAVCAIAGSTATLLGAGTCRVQATQAGNANYDPAPPVTRSFSVAPAATETQITGPSTGEPGQSLTFTAMVSSAVGTPRGTVRFRRDGIVFASATLNASGVARISSDLPEGSHRITARFIASDGYAASLSDGLMVTVTTPAPAMQVAAGLFHSCGLDSDRQAWCWGRNAAGQLGDGTADNSLVPVAVPGMNRVIQIAVGDLHSCALRDTGRVFCWGGNGSGQLGDGTTTDRRRPVRMPVNRVTQITAGGAHTCALRDSGRAFCWGSNAYGQLGNGTTTDSLTAVRVPLTGITEVAAGLRHSCVLRDTGRVFCWGRNFNGQLGDGTTTDRLAPVRVRALTDVTRIAAGGGHSCGLRGSGRVFCWGRNQGGQLGDGSTADRTVPVRVVALTRATQVVAGDRHSCALRDSGVPYCWGVNGSGQLGDGGTTNSLLPVTVSGMNRVTDIAAGGRHSCAARDTGRFFCWGNNGSGQLGNGSTDQSQVPVRVRWSQ